MLVQYKCTFFTLSLIYMPFNMSVTSVDPDQLLHMYYLIWICTGHTLVRNNLMNKKANILDPDQTARITHMVKTKIVDPEILSAKSQICFYYSVKFL